MRRTYRAVWWAARQATSTIWLTEASIATICTGSCMPISSGPIVLPPPSRERQPRGDVRRVQARHHQHVGRAGQPAERVERAQRGLQRHVRAHFAVVFEIDLSLVQDRHRLAHRRGRRGASGCRRSSATAAQRAARGPGRAPPAAAPMAMSAVCSAVGRKCISVSAMKIVVPRIAQHQRQAEGDAARRRVDRVADVLEADGGRARQAGDHRVGVAGRDHAGGEHVAVLVDHALAVALQEAAAAAAAHRGIPAYLRLLLRQPRVVDLDPLGDAEAEARHRRAHPLLAPDQHRACRSRRCGRRRRRARIFSSSPSANTTRRGLARTLSMISIERVRRSGRAGPTIRARSGADRRSAGAPRRCPSPPWRPRAAPGRSGADRTRWG